MKLWLFLTTCALSCAAVATAEDQKPYRHRFTLHTVETPAYSILLTPLGGGADFSIMLLDKISGLERRHEFQGQGANDPTPFQFGYTNYCDTMTILLTVEYPWRHDLPQFVPVLDTFAFRASDLEFIDVTFGPLTDIALADDTAYDPSETDMLPPIRVRCLLGNDAKPFEFFEQETK
jgi:hypothetical protein